MQLLIRSYLPGVGNIGQASNQSIRVLGSCNDGEMGDRADRSGEN
ncbi:hypothetical protein [Moorena producens]